MIGQLPYQLAWRANEAGGITASLGAGVFEPEITATPPDMFVAPKPRAMLASPELRAAQPYDLDKLRIGCIGAGAGSIALMSYMIARGLPPENATVIDSERSGGIWNHANVRFGGFNNPAPLQDGAGAYLSLVDRGGKHMQGFLHSMVNNHLQGVDWRRGRVAGIIPRPKGYTLATRGGDTVDVDAVVLATGASKPKHIDGQRISSNLDEYDRSRPDTRLVVERHQRELGSEELTSGRPIVIMGLGNSSGAMMHYIQKFEAQTGESVDYTVLTDASWAALRQPSTSVNGRKPIFRDPKSGYLTGFSGDLERDRSSYNRAWEEGKIISGVRAVNYSSDTDTLRVEYMSDGGRKWAVSFESPEAVFALLGHEPDLSLLGYYLKPFAAHHSSGPEPAPNVRPNDGAVFTRERAYRSNIFAIGSCAATHLNPNAAVIPGIFGQVSSTTLTLAVRYATGR